MATDPTRIDFRQATRRVLRACWRRCPNCGSGGLFKRWLVMARRCPGCHLKLDRGENDYFLGAYVVNFVTAELTIVLSGFLVVLATWPDVPWDALKWGLMAFMVPLPIVFYPFAKTLWLAIDLTFRPMTSADLDGLGKDEPASQH